MPSCVETRVTVYAQAELLSCPLLVSLHAFLALIDFLHHYESDTDRWAYSCVHMGHDADIPCLAIFNTMKYNLIKCQWASNLPNFTVTSSHRRKDLLQLWRDKNRTGVLIMESIKEKHIYTQILQQSRFCLASWLKILLVHLFFMCWLPPSTPLEIESSKGPMKMKGLQVRSSSWMAFQINAMILMILSFFDA